MKREDNRALPSDLLVRGVDLWRIYGKGRGATKALRGVDLDVASGECVALVGPSGSGKSTLLHLVGAMDRPDRGSLRVAGRDLQQLPDDDAARFRREAIGFVFQFFHLIPTLTVVDNVALPARLAGATIRSSRDRARELLARVGLEGREGDHPDGLSGGQQQRVALARALVNEPPLLLADEPTGALDRATGASILELMYTVSRERGASVIVATHDEVVMGLADRRVHIEDGQVIEGEAVAP